MRSSRAVVLTSALATLLAGALLAFGSLLATVESPEAHAAVSIAALARSDTGRLVELHGRFAPGARDASLGFVLTDGAASRVRVTPALGTMAPVMTAGELLDVHGRLERGGARPAVVATRITPERGPRVRARVGRRVGLRRLIAHPHAFDGDWVTVRGTVRDRTDSGFLLVRGRSRIFVSAPQRTPGVTDAADIAVRGRAQRLSEAAARALHGRAAGAPGRLYLILRAVEPAPYPLT